VTRVGLTNYKSIANCDVSLRPLTFLVGPNGAGKSNFLDALRFVTDALRTSLDHALRGRGGIKEVRRRSGGHPTHFSLRLEFQSALKSVAALKSRRKSAKSAVRLTWRGRLALHTSRFETGK
jgi:predicted ATPase